MLEFGYRSQEGEVMENKGPASPSLILAPGHRHSGWLSLMLETYSMPIALLPRQHVLRLGHVGQVAIESPHLRC